MVESNYAWAIKVRWKKLKRNPFFAGRYWFDKPVCPPNEGCEIALFTTRAIARKYCKKHKSLHVSLTPVRVNVVVTNE